MVRILILLAMAYLAYRWLKSKKKEPDSSASGEAPVMDEMVQCPNCGAYYPRTKGVSAKVNGKRILFCSQACQQKYLDRYKAHDSEPSQEDEK